MNFDLSFFFCALGLAIVLESLLYALFPEGMRAALRTLARSPVSSMRTGGLVGLLVGALILWCAHG